MNVLTVLMKWMMLILCLDGVYSLQHKIQLVNTLHCRASRIMSVSVARSQQVAQAAAVPWCLQSFQPFSRVRISRKSLSSLQRWRMMGNCYPLCVTWHRQNPLMWVDFMRPRRRLCWERKVSLTASAPCMHTCIAMYWYMTEKWKEVPRITSQKLCKFPLSPQNALLQFI